MQEARESEIVSRHHLLPSRMEYVLTFARQPWSSAPE